MERRKLSESFNSAIEGFIFVLKSQRNMRLHFIIAGLILLMGIYLNVDKTELLLLTIAISFVLLAEMFNTAIELVIDLITDTFHPLARIIKDITAGCVLIAAINSVVVGYLVFFHREIALPIITGALFVILLGVYFFCTRFYFKTPVLRTHIKSAMRNTMERTVRNLVFFDRFDKRFSLHIEQDCAFSDLKQFVFSTNLFL